MQVSKSYFISLNVPTNDYENFYTNKAQRVAWTYFNSDFNKYEPEPKNIWRKAFFVIWGITRTLLVLTVCHLFIVTITLPFSVLGWKEWGWRLLFLLGRDIQEIFAHLLLIIPMYEKRGYHWIEHSQFQKNCLYYVKCPQFMASFLDKLVECGGENRIVLFIQSYRSGFGADLSHDSKETEFFKILQHVNKETLKNKKIYDTFGWLNPKKAESVSSECIIYLTNIVKKIEYIENETESRFIIEIYRSSLADKNMDSKEKFKLILKILNIYSGSDDVQKTQFLASALDKLVEDKSDQQIIKFVQSYRGDLTQKEKGTQFFRILQYVKKDTLRNQHISDTFKWIDLKDQNTISKISKECVVYLTKVVKKLESVENEKETNFLIHTSNLLLKNKQIAVKEKHELVFKLINICKNDRGTKAKILASLLDVLVAENKDDEIAKLIENYSAGYDTIADFTKDGKGTQYFEILQYVDKDTLKNIRLINTFEWLKRQQTEETKAKTSKECILSLAKVGKNIEGKIKNKILLKICDHIIKTDEIGYKEKYKLCVELLCSSEICNDHAKILASLLDILVKENAENLIVSFIEMYKSKGIPDFSEKGPGTQYFRILSYTKEETLKHKGISATFKWMDLKEDLMAKSSKQYIWSIAQLVKTVKNEETNKFLSEHALKHLLHSTLCLEDKFFIALTKVVEKMAIEKENKPQYFAKFVNDLAKKSQANLPQFYKELCSSLGKIDILIKPAYLKTLCDYCIYKDEGAFYLALPFAAHMLQENRIQLLEELVEQPNYLNLILTSSIFPKMENNKIFEEITFPPLTEEKDEILVDRAVQNINRMTEPSNRVKFIITFALSYCGENNLDMIKKIVSSDFGENIKKGGLIYLLVEAMKEKKSFTEKQIEEIQKLREN